MNATYEENYTLYQWSREASEVLMREAIEIANQDQIDDHDQKNLDRLIAAACKHEEIGNKLKAEMAQMCREAGFKDAQILLSDIQRQVLKTVNPNGL